MNEGASVSVPEEMAGVRPDRAVAVLTGLSRSVSRALIEAGVVTVAGVPVTRSTRLETGDVIMYPAPSAEAPLAPEPVPFEVVLELSDLLVINKPAGLVVHPGAGHASGTLVNGLIHRYPELQALGAQYRWGLVHRLDRDTSGLLLVARTIETYEFLQAELKQRRIGRTYLALVSGHLDAATGTIDAPVGRDPVRATRMAVTQNGRPARTHYRRLAEWAETTLLEIELETGRTHQIRVHLASIGYGIIGDRVYGKRRSELGEPGRVWLHAARLRFRSIDDTHREVSTPLPADLSGSLDRLGDPISGDLFSLEP
ncbi:MAG: RluA family pseudouridine synthase [Actinomycetota bacterium]|nr:RluA family pseudouridine synthase [Actinomycetota bacterium]